MSLLNRLGIFEDSIENAYHQCKEILNAIYLGNQVDYMVELLSTEVVDNVSWQNATNEIISLMFDIAKCLIYCEYPDVDVNCSVNGYDSHIELSQLDIFAELAAAKLEKELVKKIMLAELYEYFTTEKIVEMAKDSKLIDDIIRVYYYQDDITLYDNINELGADNSDNGCRNENESDEDFGRFLLQAYKDGNSKDIYFEFADGSVMSAPLY